MNPKRTLATYIFSRKGSTKYRSSRVVYGELSSRVTLYAIDRVTRKLPHNQRSGIFELTLVAPRRVRVRRVLV